MAQHLDCCVGLVVILGVFLCCTPKVECNNHLDVVETVDLPHRDLSGYLMATKDDTGNTAVNNPETGAAEVERQGVCSGSLGSALLGYPPGSMGGAYALVASLTINACIILFFSSICVVKVVSSKLVEKHPAALTVRNLAEDKPWVVGKIVTEQVTTLVLIFFSVYALFATDIATFPFNGSTCSDVISLGFAANIGRYAFRTLQDVYLCEQLKKWWISCLHHLVAAFCLVTMVTYGQNLLLGVVGVLMEGNNICFDVMWLFKICEIPPHHRLYVVMATLAFVLSILLRFLLPISFTVFACVRQSPLSMHPVPLFALFLAVVFFVTLNLWFTYNSFRKLTKSLDAQKVKKLESIVESKTPDLLNLPRSKRNILATNNPLDDPYAINNSSANVTAAAGVGLSQPKYRNNNLIDANNLKSDKTPFNMILMNYRSPMEDHRTEQHQHRDLFVRDSYRNSSSSSSSATFSRNSVFPGQGPEVNPTEEFEDVPLSSLEIEV